MTPKLLWTYQDSKLPADFRVLCTDIVATRESRPAVPSESSNRVASRRRSVETLADQIVNPYGMTNPRVFQRTLLEAGTVILRTKQI